MPKYIELEKALQRFEEIKKNTTLLKESFYLDGVMAILETIPAADVAPVVHGEWMRYSRTLWHYCSVCLEDALMSKSTGTEVLSSFCPHCGAKMDLEESR